MPIIGGSGGGVTSIVQASVVSVSSGDLTTASTSFTDATGLTTTITTGGHRCLVIFSGWGNNSTSGQNTAVDLAIDGTRQGQTYGLAITGAGGTTGANGSLSFTFLTAVLSAASHTFKIQFRADGGTAKIWASAAVTAATITVIETGLTT